MSHSLISSFKQTHQHDAEIMNFGGSIKKRKKIIFIADETQLNLTCDFQSGFTGRVAGISTCPLTSKKGALMKVED